MISISKTTKLLLLKNKHAYMSPVDKPILSLSLNSLIQFSAHLQQIPYAQILVTPEISVLMGGIMFRLLTEGVCTILRGFKFKGEQRVGFDYVGRVESESGKESEEKEIRPALRWMQRVFVVDAVRDYQFYGLQRKQINRNIHMFLRPSVMFANLANFYLCLNFLRGSNYLITNPQFQSFCLQCQYLPSLTLYDPYFISPLMAIASTYFVLRYSRHPLMVHLTHPGNIVHCFNIAFMVGLLMVPVPGVYHFAYTGLMVGHLGIRSTRHYLRDMGYSLFRRFKK